MHVSQLCPLFTEYLRRNQPVEELSWCPLSPQIGDRTQPIWDVSSPIRGRARPGTDFFNRSGRSPKYVCRIVHNISPLADKSPADASPRWSS
jgi:hypothetical protein